MVRGTNRTRRVVKKSLRGLRDFLRGEAAPPILLIEGRLLERFGWTFEQLDAQDSGRTLQTVSMMNIASLYPAVLDAINRHSLDGLSPAHWNAFKLIGSLQGDEDGD